MKNVERYLESFGKQVVNRAKGNLKKRDKVVTGKLLNSIKYNINKTADGYTLEFSMLDYGKFIDKGVSGTKKKRSFVDYEGKRKTSPFSYGKSRDGGLTKALDKWIVRRGIAPRDKKGKFLSRKSLKFLIARKIYLYGKQGISFFQKPLGLGLKQFGKEMLGAVKEDILNGLTTVK